MIEALVAAWGQWPVFVGLAVVAFVRAWQVASLSPSLSPSLAWLWASVPSQLRPAIAVLGAGLPAFGAALIAGRDWAGAGDAALVAWVAAAAGQEALRLVAGKVGAS
jgi:hypothetical protein